METIIRIGIVTAVDDVEWQVRVQFSDVDIVSGWLKVVRAAPSIPNQQTEETSGGSDEASFEKHSHKIKMKPWFPVIGDNVLCIYNPGFNEDGYVLGVL